jgi:hypothetical protein
MNRQISFSQSVFASLIATIIFAGTSRVISQSWAIAALAFILWLGFVAAMAVLIRRNYKRTRQSYISFLAPMSTEQAKKRIRAAQSEVWSFQISGSEFTANSIETYETWLSGDRNRSLSIAFANPENENLLKNIVKLSGFDKRSNEDHEFKHLRAMIKTTLDKYIGLRDKFGDRVDVRVYDFSPPYSVHAVDPDPQDDHQGSVFVELYLPDLPAHERPCMLLPQDHTAYALYLNKSLAWFEGARPMNIAPVD